jgi:hypothetical protein
VRISAQLHHDPGGGRRGEVGRHARGGTAEEAELRFRHASVTDRQELGDPALALCLEHGNRVRPIRSRLPVSVAAAGHVLAQGTSGSDAVGAIDGPGVALQRGGTGRPLERGAIYPPRRVRLRRRFGHSQHTVGLK